MGKRNKKPTEPKYTIPDENSDPYAEGADAYLSGMGDDKNPYEPDTDAQASWNDGWNSQSDAAHESGKKLFDEE